MTQVCLLAGHSVAVQQTRCQGGHDPVCSHGRKSYATLFDCVLQGLAKRHIGSTAMNHESSRSHLIISCMVEGVNLQSQAVTRGKISFVDLAGSER